MLKSKFICFATGECEPTFYQDHKLDPLNNPVCSKDCYTANIYRVRVGINSLETPSIKKHVSSGKEDLEATHYSREFLCFIFLKALNHLLKF